MIECQTSFGVPFVIRSSVTSEHDGSKRITRHDHCHGDLKIGRVWVIGRSRGHIQGVHQAASLEADSPTA
jgi:hypothetical protein